jgi:hypothetical protein
MPSKKNNQKLAHSKGLIWLRRRFGEREEIKEYELQAIHNKVNFQCTNILIRKNIYIYESTFLAKMQKLTEPVL